MIIKQTNIKGLSSVTTKSAAVSSSFTFDGINEKMEVPSNYIWDKYIQSTKAFSFGLWVKPNDITGLNALMNKYDSGGSSGVEMLMQDDGKLRYIIGGTGVINGTTNLIQTTNIVITQGVWNHIIYTYDGGGDVSGMKIYIDGVAVPTTTTYNALGTKDINNTRPWAIGYENYFTIKYLNGTIATPRVWNVELTAPQVLAEYNAGKVKETPSEPTIMNLDFTNATLSGQWAIPNLSGFIGGASFNMDITNKVTDIP